MDQKDKRIIEIDKEIKKIYEEVDTYPEYQRAHAFTSLYADKVAALKGEKNDLLYGTHTRLIGSLHEQIYELERKIDEYNNSSVVVKKLNRKKYESLLEEYNKTRNKMYGYIEEDKKIMSKVEEDSKGMKM